MTDPTPQDDPEPLAIEPQSAATTRAADTLRKGAGWRYVVFRGVEDQPDGSLHFMVTWDGATWALTADEALLLSFIAARQKHGRTGYRRVSYRHGLIRSEESDDPHARGRYTEQ